MNGFNIKTLEEHVLPRRTNEPPRRMTWFKLDALKAINISVKLFSLVFTLVLQVCGGSADAWWNRQSREVWKRVYLLQRHLRLHDHVSRKHTHAGDRCRYLQSQLFIHTDNNNNNNSNNIDHISIAKYGHNFKEVLVMTVIWNYTLLFSQAVVLKFWHVKTVWENMQINQKISGMEKHNYDDADRHLGFADRGAAVVDSFFWNRVCQGPVRRNSHVELTVTESCGWGSEWCASSYVVILDVFEHICNFCSQILVLVQRWGFRNSPTATLTVWSAMCLAGSCVLCKLQMFKPL